MPSYTLNYFNQRGRAEICRMLFAAAGVQYNDKRVEPAEWKTFMTKVPCSMLPMLEIDNKIQIPQSMAIARFLAREFGFHGKNNLDMARVEYISDCFYDIMDDYMRMYQDEEGKILPERQMRYEETLSRILPFMEKTLEMCNGGKQFFMGDQMTMADMMCFCTLENPVMEDPTLLISFPKLMALRARVMNHPKLAPYLQKRPKTDF